MPYSAPAVPMITFVPMTSGAIVSVYPASGPSPTFTAHFSFPVVASSATSSSSSVATNTEPPETATPRLFGPQHAALSSMSFVTTARGAAGSAMPPDPCAHSGAPASDATAAAAHHRAQRVIPTSVESRRLFPSTDRESDVDVAAGSRLIIAPIRRVDNHRPYVAPVEHVIEAQKRVRAHAPHRSGPADADVGHPPGQGDGVGRVADQIARRMRLLDLHPAAAREGRATAQQEMQPVLRDTRQGSPRDRGRPDRVLRVAKVGVRPRRDQVQTGRDLQVGAELETPVAGAPCVLVVDTPGRVRRDRIRDELAAYLGVEQCKGVVETPGDV